MTWRALSSIRLKSTRMPDKADLLSTPDGRYFVVRGRLWRMSNPDLQADVRQRLVDRLMDGRRQVKSALRSKDAEAERTARALVDEAKRGLGERGRFGGRTVSRISTNGLLRTHRMRTGMPKQQIRLSNAAGAKEGRPMSVPFLHGT